MLSSLCGHCLPSCQAERQVPGLLVINPRFLTIFFAGVLESTTTIQIFQPDFAPTSSADDFSARNTKNATGDEEPGATISAPPVTIVNAVVKYVFPVICSVGVATNGFSLATILNSNIRHTSTGLYLGALAVIDTICLYLWSSSVWARPVFGYHFPPMHICSFKQFGMGTFFSMSAMCIVCVTTDRFLAVWFPFRAKTLATRRRAAFVLLSLGCALLAMYLPVFWGVGRNCELLPNIPFYTNYVFYGLACLNASYGPAIYLLCCNIAISVKLAFPSLLLQGASAGSPREKNSRIIVMVLLVSAAFIVLTIPSSLLVTLRAAGFNFFGNKFAEEVAYTVTRLMVMTNYGINFFLYVISSSNFRRSLVSLFTRRCCSRDAGQQ